MCFVALLLASCVTLDKSLTLSELHFLIGKMGIVIAPILGIAGSRVRPQGNCSYVLGTA
jgi:hypothetical protein